MWLFVPKKDWLTKYLDHICLQSFSNYQPFNATETKSFAQRRRNKFNRQTRSNPRLFRSEPVQQVFFPKQWNETEKYFLDQNDIFLDVCVGSEVTSGKQSELLLKSVNLNQIGRQSNLRSAWGDRTWSHFYRNIGLGENLSCLGDPGPTL